MTGFSYHLAQIILGISIFQRFCKAAIDTEYE